jgi:NADPH:quinone reductase-like Zn-dependent oxidoreductase
MRAVQYAQHGGPEVLHLADDVPEPHAGPGQLRVAVKAAGLNAADWKMRAGMMGGGALDAPKIPGFEAAGVVDEVGEGVGGVVVGDEVFGSAASGAYAEYAVLGAFADKPASMTWEEAAGLPVAVETSVRAMDIIGLGHGDTVVINGGSGGVGQAAVQLALARGAKVIATASEPNQELLRDLGATPTTYGEGLPARVTELAPDGVDAALDVVGHGALPELIEIAGGTERVVTIADFQLAGELGVTATGGSEGRSWQALTLAAGLFEKGEFHLPVGQTFPLAEAAEAQRVSEQGHPRGKLVLVP